MQLRYVVAYACHHLTRLVITAARCAPRSLLACAALALTLGIGSSDQVALAQEGQAPLIDYAIDFGTPRTSICVGETVPIPVRVIARVFVPGDPNVGLHRVLGVALAASTDTSILQDVTTSQTTPSLYVDEPLSTTYLFKGKAPGRTSIQFTGSVRTLDPLYGLGFPLEDSLAVRVIPCNLLVVTVSRWTVNLTGGKVTALAIVHDGRMTGDQEGYYTGEAGVTWIVTASIPGCGYSSTLNFSKVNLRGRLDENNQIHVDLTFPALSGTEVIPCPGVGTGGGGVTLTPASMSVIVPIYGGVPPSIAQILTHPAGRTPGAATVYVFPQPTP
jgi:hypothetical protein